MKTHLYPRARFLFLFCCLCIFNVNAKSYTVLFGGSTGFKYSPSQLSINVGDTIVWNGDFSMHPLASTSVPSGASTFNHNSGSSFSYVVTVAGTYDYHCTVHSVMVGSFSAAELSIQNFIFLNHTGNTFTIENRNGILSIHSAAPVKQISSFAILDLAGRYIAGSRSLSTNSLAGNRAFQVVLPKLPAGRYMAMLGNDKEAEVITFMNN